MKHQITFKNILQYLEGNTQLVLEELYLQPQHIHEQIAYRRLMCKDTCAKTNACEICGCDFKGKTSVKESCNPDRFPDLMSRNEWIKFKKENGIV
jgi:hypothetical protein